MANCLEFKIYFFKFFGTDFKDTVTFLLFLLLKTFVIHTVDVTLWSSKIISTLYSLLEVKCDFEQDSPT